MTSYFEIAGHIVECHDVLTSPELAKFVSEVVKPVAAEVSDSFSSLGSDKKETKDPLWEHWLKVVSLPARSLPDLVLKPNPIVFVPRAIAVGLKQVEMNYDYFVKGESHGWTFYGID